MIFARGFEECIGICEVEEVGKRFRVEGIVGRIKEWKGDRIV